MARSPDPKTRKPRAREAESFRLEELADAVRVPVRTIRYYIQRGLLAAPDFRGAHTIYTREHRLRLDAIRALQERDLPLDEIARRLAAMTPGELAAAARGELAAEPARSPVAPERMPPLPVPAARRWVLVLAPGLELHLAEDAPASSHRLAARLARLQPHDSDR
jgi:DNA-binding transcriptional MerR regulator